MKTTLIMAASLAFATAAFAQSASMPAGPETTNQTPAQAGSTPTESSAGSATSAPSDSAPAPSGNGGMSSGGMSSGGMSSGGMSSGNMGQAQQMASSTDTSSYPKCSKGMTDKCVQGGGMGGMHKKRMMHKPS